MKKEPVIRDSYFDGHLLQQIGTNLLSILIIIITLGICTPWAVCIRQRWYIKHTVIEGKRLTFDGKAVQLFGQWIKWLLLIIITLGIYGFWVNLSMKRWLTKHIHTIN